MQLLHALADGVFADTLILFSTLVLAGHLLAGRQPAFAASRAMSVAIAWIAVFVGLAAIAESVAVVDGLFAVLTSRDEEGGATLLGPILDAEDGYDHAQSIALLLAVAVNVVWARTSRARYLFLNPLHLLLATALLLALFSQANASPYVAVPITAFVVGSAAAWLPYLAEGPLALGGRPFALGTFHTLLLGGARWAGARFAGGPKEGAFDLDAEDLARSPLLFAAVLVGGVAAFLALVVGPEKSTTVLQGATLLHILPSAGSTYYALGGLFVGFELAAGLWVLLLALPRVVAAVNAAAPGLARLAPGSKPALDAIFVLPDAPRAAVSGFLLSLAGGLLGFYIAGAMGLAASAPGVLTAMTAGGAAGVLADRAGGRRGLMIAASAHGLVLSILVALGATLASDAIAVELGDVSVLGAVLSLVLKPF